MAQRSQLLVRNSGNESMTLIVEPWANEYQVPPRTELTVVAIHPALPPHFSVERVENGLVVWVEASGSVYEIWRGTDMLDRTDNAIPPVP